MSHISSKQVLMIHYFFQIVSFGPFSQGQCRKDLPRHYTQLWKRRWANREQLMGRQPIVSVAGAIGLFLWFISLIEAKPNH